MDYLRPTPLGVALEVRGKVEEIEGPESGGQCHGVGRGVVCALGQVVAVQMPEHMVPTAGPR